MKNLNDLPNDIYQLFSPDEHHEVSESNLENFCNNMKDLLRNRLSERKEGGGGLRFSNLGKPDRQLWYDTHPVDGGREQMQLKNYVKFLYGDVIEQLVLFLAVEAGHTVTHEQAEVEVDGIKGHIDAVIDGVVVDVKSAAPYSYKKFAQGNVTEDDPFGYTEQLSGYASVLTPGEDAAWVAVDKVGGDICVAPLRKTIIEHYKPKERIDHLREVLSRDEPPSFCYEEVEDGKSGNLKLPVGCSYCPSKFRCRPGTRTFLYSSGPRFLTRVVKTPDVPEVTDVSIDAE